jgi:MIP family channel proteins
MNKYVAEVVGTFALVFAGTGAIIINVVSEGAITHVGIALTFGLIVTAMIYSIGEVSGAHINPAATIAFWAAGRFEGARVVPYIVAQMLGAISASATLRVMFPDDTTLGATLPFGSWFQSFVLEIILTFILMFVVLCVTSGAKEKGLLAGVAIGGTVALDALFGGPISGASMNPARSLAPALVSGNLQHFWIYIVAPILGALAAIPVQRVIYADHATGGEDAAK